VAGATIDHMISLTILIAALLVAMMTYNGLFASAVDYDRNRQVANKAVDLINTICLSPGSPTNWGATNDSVFGFGLQDPQTGGYALSPYSIMRLRTSNDSQLVEYYSTYYNNISLGYGGYLLIPVADCINYTTATELLGVNRTYGFRVDIVPTLNVDISQFSEDPYLKLKVDVRGPGLSLGGVTLNYYLFQIIPGEEDEEPPTILTQEGVVQTDPDGSKLIHFPSVDNPDAAYYFIVYARLSGLDGVGYFSQDDLGSDPQYLVPFIQDFDNGTVIIAHNWDVHYFGPPEPAVMYNATFFALSQDFHLTRVQIENSTGLLNYGSKSNATTQIQASETGFLFIAYQGRGHVGSIVMPWGVSTLGVSTSFGGDPTGYDFVATELRQVTIDNISYQVKVSAWKLGS